MWHKYSNPYFFFKMEEVSMHSERKSGTTEFLTNLTGVIQDKFPNIKIDEIPGLDPALDDNESRTKCHG